MMRDRETDSWWSIMTSDAIGGDLSGTDLVELPLGEKTTWGDWRRRHPDTVVLSVEGREHVENNPYDNYFASEGTFRDLVIEDQRLAAKAPVYVFWLGGEPWAVAHSAFSGGRVLELEGIESRALMYRDPDAAIFESTRAYLVDPGVARPGRTVEELLALAESSSEAGIEPLPGFDTFWYSWVAVNTETRLVE